MMNNGFNMNMLQPNMINSMNMNMNNMNNFNGMNSMNMNNMNNFNGMNNMNNMNNMGMNQGNMMNNMNNMGMNQGNMMNLNPMMMNTMVRNQMMNSMMNTMVGNPMMNPIMMNTMTGNQMMMNNIAMMNNQNRMNQMMNILNNSQNSNQNNQDNNNMDNINVPQNNVQNNQVPDLSVQIKKQEEEKRKKLIAQIINQETNGEGKHCKELETISNMAIMGSITKNYIKVDTNNNPNKYISTQNALNFGKDGKEYYYFVLGIISDYLSKQGVLTAIEKKDQNQLSKEKLKEIDTFLQFLINGLSNLKKHELRFDFGWDKNQLILSDIKEQEDFLNELRYSLSKGFNIQSDRMVITYPRSGSVLVTIVFGTEDYNNLTVNTLQNIFAQHAPNLNHLIGIESNLVLDGILLNPELLDARGNNLNQGWEEMKKGEEETIILLKDGKDMA